MMSGEHNECLLGITPKIMLQLVADQGKQTAQLEHIAETVGTIENCLLGNGKDGLIVRTDRLEQKDKTRGRFFWALFGIVAALVIQTVASTLFDFVQ